MLEILSYSFLQNALISIILLSAILPLLGIFLSLKKTTFIGDALAHASLLGVSLGFILGINSLITTLLFLVFCGIFIFFLQKKSYLNYDLIVMIISILGMSLGILIFSLSPLSKSSVVSYLFGNILLIEKFDILILLFLSIFIFIIAKIYLKDALLTFINKDLAYTENVKTDIIEFFFFVILSLVIGLSIKMIGALLVSALIVLPVSIGKIISSSFKSLVLNSILWSELMGISGLLISYFLDLPPGPVIASLGILALLLILTIKVINDKILK